MAKDRTTAVQDKVQDEEPEEEHAEPFREEPPPATSNPVTLLKHRIAQAEAQLASLKTEQSRLYQLHQKSLDACKRADANMRSVRAAAQRATADYQGILESEATLQGTVNRLRSELSVLNSRASGIS